MELDYMRYLFPYNANFYVRSAFDRNQREILTTLFQYFSHITDYYVAEDYHDLLLRSATSAMVRRSQRDYDRRIDSAAQKGKHSAALDLREERNRAIAKEQNCLKRENDESKRIFANIARSTRTRLEKQEADRQKKKNQRKREIQRLQRQLGDASWPSDD